MSDSWPQTPGSSVEAVFRSFLAEFAGKFRKNALYKAYLCIYDNMRGVGHVRTTIDIDDDLGIRAKKAAVERRTTLRDLVEEGLRLVLDQRPGAVRDPMDRLAGLGREIWDGVNPDEYVRGSRRSWE